MAGGLNLGRAESRCLIAAVLSAFSFSAFDAQAQLTGGRVVGGQATISSPSATSTLIHQTSPTAIINWQSFSIPSGASVTFQQPGASAIALNRVTGGSASLIYGSLTANGQVWLINPNGIALGPTAQVSAAGVLLSTMGIRDQDFLAGNYTFGIPGDPNASIVNQGRIVATDAGSVILAAPKVRNDGLIEADLGTVVLAGAKTVTVDFAGDDLLKFAVPVAAVDTVAPGTDALVSNTGTIAAPGGRVLLTAAAAKGVLDNVINTSGIVEATSVASVNGKIVLSATGGAAQVSGTLDASGKGAGETGGAIDVLGDAVTVAAGAKLDASGDAGGGTVLVGGNFHGAGPEQNAQTTIVEADSQIDVSAISQGNGGRVAVWSDGSTNFSGSILARGGAQGGDGGYVETSGATLWDRGTVDTRAPFGHVGMWLLDPSVLVQICVTCGVTPGSIITALGSSDFAVTSAGGILVSDQVTYSSPNQLNLLAQGDITFNASVQNAGGGALNVFAGWDGSTGLSGNSFAPGTAIGANAFGIGGLGNVAIGDGTQFGGIAVGSAGGTTTVAAANLTLRGSDQNVTNSFAQLGFHGGGSTGDIAVNLTGSLTLTGGAPSDASNNFAMIGHGGGTNGSNSGNITITAAGDVMLFGGAAAFEDYAQIGHGGADSNNSVQAGSISQTGTISVTAANVTLTGGAGDTSYAQIGHGGYDVDFGATVGGGSGSVTLSGDIDVLAANILSMTSPNSGSIAYTQIGHGGLAANGGISGNSTVSGNITVSAASLTMTGGNAGNLVPGYAQIGHGGFQFAADASGNSSISGTIQVTIGAGGASLSGGGAAAPASDYAQIGHGDALTSANADASGDIILHVAGTTTLNNTLDSVAFIGNMSGTNVNSGNVEIVTGSLVAGSAVQAIVANDILGGNVLIANQGTNTITINNGVGYGSIFDLTVLSGGSLVVNGSLQNSDTGAVTVVAGWDGATGLVGGQVAGFSPATLLGTANSYGRNGGDITIGSGSQTFSVVVGSLGGGTTVAGRNITLNAGLAIDGPAAAQIGDNLGGGFSDINVAATGSVTLNGGIGGGGGAYAQIGFGGTFNSVGSGGNITVKAGGDVTLNAGAGNEAYAQIGHGGVGFDGDDGGTILVNAGGNVVLNGGGGNQTYAQIGHGGAASTGSNSGGIIVTVGGSVTLAGGTATASYAQIGHGGADSSTTNAGNITVAASTGVTLLAGTGGEAYAQIGQAGYNSSTDPQAFAGNAAVTVTVSNGDVVLTGGSGGSGGLDYAMIGNGDPVTATEGTVVGDIILTVSGSTTLTSTSDGVAFIGNDSATGPSIGNYILQSGSFVSNGGALEASIAAGMPGGVVSVTSTGPGALTLAQPIDYTSTHPLVLSASSIVIGGGIDNADAGSITLSGATVSLAQTLATAGGAITVNGNAVLTQNLTLDTTNQGQAPGGATVAISGSLNDAAAGTQSLAVTTGGGTFMVAGPIGNVVPLGSITMTAGLIDLTGQIVTQGGDIAFNGPVSFSNGPSIDTTAGGTAAPGAVTFAQGGSFNLNGGTFPLGGAFTFANGGFTVTGTGQLLIGPGTSVTANGPITIGSAGSLVTINGQNGGEALVLDAGGNPVSLYANLGGTAPLGSLTVSGSSITLGGTANTTGAQTYNGPVTIDAIGATLNASSFLFISSINGPGALALADAPAQQVLIGGDVGVPTPLASFSVSANTIVIGGSVVTVGPQSYSDNTLVLDAASNPNAVYQTNGATFTELGSTFLGGSPTGGAPPNIVFDTTGGGASPGGANITFASSGSIDGDVALSFAAGGGGISVGVIGGSIPLASVNVVSGASFVFVPPVTASGGFTCPPTICIPPEVDDTDATNLQQQLVSHLPGTTLLDIELPPPTLGISPPLPIFLSSSGPSLGPDSSGGGDGTMLTSVVDLDTGSQLFSQISPNSGTSEETPEPLTILEPITPAPQPVPPTQNAEEPIGGTGGLIFRTRIINPNLPGIPGVDQPSLGAGNRGLWFAAPPAP
jgi:filamentous hemagglutinin family protein